LINLITNAIKFTSYKEQKNRNIIIKLDFPLINNLSQDLHKIVKYSIKVIDKGIGISHNDMNHIFTEFF
jgi:signal transduction histidine kinase